MAKMSWSTSNIDKLVKKALKGDDNAYDILRNMERTITKRANSRLLGLERIGRDTTSAYKFAKERNNPWDKPGVKNRFRLSKAGIFEIASNIEITKKFLRYKTSTVTGVKRLDKKIIDAFRDKGVKIPAGQEQDFLELLESDEFQELKKTYQDSGVSVSDLTKLSMLEDFDINKYREMIKRVTSNELTYDKAMSELGIVI